MSVLQRSPKEVLINQLNGDMFKVGYDPKVGRYFLHDVERGLVIKGRPLDATYHAVVDTSYQAFKTAVPSITAPASNVLSYAVGSTSAGVKRKITLTPLAAAYAAGKFTSVFVTNVPRVSGINTVYDKFAITRNYTVDTDTLAAAAATNLVDALVALINADLEGLVNATNDTGTLVLEAKDASVMFAVSTSTVGKDITAIPGMAFTAVYTVKGSYPVLDYDWLYKQFSITPGSEGMKKDLPIDADYSMIKVVYKLDDHPGVVTASELVTQYDAITYYILKSEMSKDIFNSKLYLADGTQAPTVGFGTVPFFTGPAVASGGLTLLNLFKYTLLPSSVAI